MSVRDYGLGLRRDEVSVGQEVQVFGRYGRAGSETGVIEKVGRTLVYIRWHSWGEPDAFRLDDQSANNGYSQYFRTAEQVVLDQRQKAAVESLRGVGLTLEFRCSLTLEQLEAVVRALDESSKPDAEVRS